jgi:hypothetical protein
MSGIARGLRSLATVAPVLVLVGGLALGCGSDSGGPSAADDPTASSSSLPAPSDSASVSASPSESTAGPGDGSSSAPPDWPACGRVWVADADLPDPYAGCLRGGEPVAAAALRCSAGVRLVTYDDRFWGVPGHRISEADGSLRHDSEFRQTRATCTA